MNTMRVLWVALFCLITVVWPVSGANADTYDIMNDPLSDYGNLKPGDWCVGGLNYLGPIAAVNSFIYLQNRCPNIYDARLVPGDPIDTAMALAWNNNYMRTGLAGTQIQDFYWGKYNYIENQLTGKTVYAGGNRIQWLDY